MDAPPQLSLFAFHLDVAGRHREEENAATRDAARPRDRDRGRVMLTGCRVDGRFLGRVCVLSFRTRHDRIDDCVEHVAQEAAALLRQLQSG